MVRGGMSDRQDGEKGEGRGKVRCAGEGGEVCW